MLCIRAAAPAAALPMQLQIHAQTSVMETLGNCTGNHASAALTADPNCRSGEGSIWFVSWLSLKPLGLTSGEAPTVIGITTCSYLRSRQVKEQLHCEKLRFLMMGLCWHLWPKKETSITLQWTNMVWKWEKKTRTDFFWNTLPSPEHISIFVEMGHIHVEPMNGRIMWVPHMPHELMWTEVQKVKEWSSSLNIYLSGGAGHDSTGTVRQCPALGRLSCIKKQLSNSSAALEDMPWERGHAGRSLASPGIS